LHYSVTKIRVNRRALRIKRTPNHVAHSYDVLSHVAANQLFFRHLATLKPYLPTSALFMQENLKPVITYKKMSVINHSTINRILPRTNGESVVLNVGFG
jgi:hypothetical protein